MFWFFGIVDLPGWSWSLALGLEGYRPAIFPVWAPQLPCLPTMINSPPWIMSSCQAFSHREKKGNSFNREYKRPFWQCSTSWPCRWLHEYKFCLNMLRILARWMWVYPNYIKLKLIKRGDWRRKRRKTIPDWIKLYHSQQLIFWYIKRVKLCCASCAEPWSGRMLKVKVYSVYWASWPQENHGSSHAQHGLKEAKLSPSLRVMKNRKSLGHATQIIM